MMVWQTPTHSLQIYARGESEGELISFSTCSCVLWQKEQRNGSSGLNFFTGLEASAPLGLRRLYPYYSRPICSLSKRESRGAADYRERALGTYFERQSTSRPK